MLNPYWLKIGGGALAIFGVGMGTITVARKGMHQFKSFTSASVQRVLRDVPGQFLTFRLDGDRLGRLKSLDLSSDGALTAESVKLDVALDQADAVKTLAHCNLAADRLRSGHDDLNFRCVDASDLADEDLTQIGEARFEPGSLVRPLYAHSRDISRIGRSDLKNLKANLSSEDGKTVHGKADFDLNDRHGSRQKGTVNLDAADGRALIEIKDENGNELFHLRADDHGVSLNAKDRRGRELMKLLAGETGVHLNVKSDSKAERDEQ